MLGYEDFSRNFEAAKFLSTFSKSRVGSASELRSRPISAPMSIASLRSVLSQDVDPIKSFSKIVQVSPLTLEQLFKEIDQDSSGKISQIEFRNAIRKLNLGLTSRDIDNIICRVDSNNDGQIDWQEFVSKFRRTEADDRIKAISRTRLDKLRDLMFAYMLSPKDAFRQADQDRSGHLDYPAFSGLVNKLYSLGGEPAPSFTVVKDLFELIDIRSDGVLDIKEWLNSFRKAEQANWEDVQEFEAVSFMISKHRKLLLLTFNQIAESAGSVSVTSAKEILSSSLRELKLTDQQWDRILRPAVHGSIVDHRAFLDIYKARATTASQHPRPRV
jgi:Ca2+-binding EF-hand superfamily protein